MSSASISWRAGLSTACMLVLTACSDPFGAHLPEVRSLTLLQDSVPVMVGESTRLLATAISTDGAPLGNDAARWATRDRGVLEAKGAGIFVGVRVGRAWAIAENGSHLDSALVMVRPRYAVSLAPEQATITSLGDTLRLTATVAGTTNPEDPPRLTWAARDAAVASVSQSGLVTARSVGDSWVMAYEDGGSVDSTRIVVQQRLATVRVLPEAISRPMLRAQRFTATALDAGGSVIPDVTFAWSITGTAATIDPSGVARAQTPGVATIRATADGASASATLTVTALPALRWNADTFDIGVGQYTYRDGGYLRLLADSLDPDEVVLAPLTNDAPSVVSAPALVQVPEYLGVHTSGDVRITGTGAGITTVTAEAAPRFTPAQVVVRVSSPRLVIDAPDTLEVSAGSALNLLVHPADSLGGVHAVASPLPIAIRSSAPDVLALNATSMQIVADGSTTTVTSYVRAAGTSWLVVTAAGYRPDSVLVRVPGQKLRFVSWWWDNDVDRTTVGAEESSGTMPRVQAPCCFSIDLTIAISQRHPELLRVPTKLVARAGIATPTTLDPLVGLHPGTDTVVASAPGMSPDTLIVTVTTPTYRTDPLPAVPGIGMPFSLAAFVADTAGGSHFPATGEATVLLNSSDTTVLRPRASRFVIGNSTGGGGTMVDVFGAGRATLTLRDADGDFIPISRSFTVPSVRLQLVPQEVNESSPDSVTLGMRQRLLPYHGVHVRLENSGWVLPPIQLRSTDPTVVRPATEQVALDGAFDLLAGDQGGRAWIVASSGTVIDSIPVIVGRPTVAVFTPSAGRSGTTSSESGHLELRDQAGRPRLATEPVTFHLESSNYGIVTPDPSTITIPAGALTSTTFTLRFLAPGSATIRAVDARAVPYAYEAGAGPVIQVTPASP
jgi:hypothetical protein